MGSYRGKLPVLNIHGYVKKTTRSAHDIKRLQWCFDTCKTPITLNYKVIILQICHILTTGLFLTWLECLKEICLKNTRNIGRKV